MSIFPIKKILAMVLFFLVAFRCGGTPYVSNPVDLRNRQHGINVLKTSTSDYLLIWSSAGNPPIAPTGSWPHDIYFAAIDPAHPETINPETWLSGDEAQEPASSAINASGDKVFCTWEDGNEVENSVGQRFFLSDVSEMGGDAAENYASVLENEAGNDQIFYDGGHSGHTAAVGDDYFVTTWVDGWINHDDGVDGLGSGDIVYVSSIDTVTGVLEDNRNMIEVASGRQWWPVIAGSATKACIVWQSFVDGKEYADLKMMIYDPSDGNYETISGVQTIMHNVLYYTYSVQYIPVIDRFLIMASKDGGAGSDYGRLCSGGKAFLVDNNGTITASLDLDNGVIRESQSIVSGSRIVQSMLKNGESTFGDNSYGGAKGGVMVLDLTATTITVTSIINDSYEWFYMGNDGFINGDKAHIYALSPDGIQVKSYDLP